MASCGRPAAAFKSRRSPLVGGGGEGEAQQDGQGEAGHGCKGGWGGRGRWQEPADKSRTNGEKREWRMGPAAAVI